MTGQKNNTLTNDELSVLCWQLAELSRAGVSWSGGAELLLEDTNTPRVRLALEAVRDGMEGGGQLAQVLEETGQFPPYLLRMVEIGQVSGRLDQVFAALATYYRRESSTADAVRRAVTYPAVMAALISLVFLVLVVRVLPVFSQVFSQIGAGVSPLVSALLRSGGAGKYVGIGLAALLLVASSAALVLFRGDRGMKLFSHGKAAEAVARGRFASAMSLMLSSGLPLDEATDRTAELLAGSPLSAAFEDCRTRMSQGEPFPKAVSASGMLSGLQAGMLSAGFRAGNTESAMNELAARSQEDAETRLDRLLSRFEYILVIVLCAAVGLVLLSVMLPLLGVLSAIGG